MQGAAKTDDFMLGTATIMLGPVADLFNLVNKHSIGLVKNVTVKTAPGFVELTQGVRNSLVHSTMNSNAGSVTAEMYEYTPTNIAYSLSLDGSQITRETVVTTVAVDYVAPVDPALLGDDEISLTAATGLTAGSSLLIHTGKDDNVMLRKIVSIDAVSKIATLNAGMPVGVVTGSKVEKVNIIAFGSQENAPFLSCKIVGTLANGETVPMFFPKVRVKSGLNMAFKTDNYDNIPLELDIFDLVEGDPYYDMFQTIGPNGTPAKGMILD